MGNEYSHNPNKQRFNTRPFGQVYLQIDPRAYYEQETISGHIYLDLYQPYGKSKMVVQFKGKEKCHFVEYITREWNKNSDFSFNVTSEYHSNNKGELYQSNFTICTWENLQPGQHAIPFSIKVPSGLFASFDYQDKVGKNIYNASILYRLEARLEPDLFNLPQIKYKQPINIRGTPPKSEQNIYQKLETPRTSFFVLSKGKTSLSVSLERDFVNYGEPLIVKIIVDNSQSQIDSQQVVVKLINDLVLKAEQRALNRKIVKFRQRLGSVPAGKISQENILSINLMPGGMESSVDTGSIQSSYRLEVSLDGSSLDGSAKSCTFPINIGCGDGAYTPIDVPANWNPRIVEKLNLAIGLGSALERAVKY